MTLPQAWSPPVRASVILSLYFTASYLLSLTALVFSPSPEPALVFPGIALDLALPLVFGLAYAPALIFAPFTGAALGLLFGTPTLGFTSALLSYALVKFVVYGGAAWFLLRVATINPRLGKLRDISWFLFAGSFVAPGLAALLNEAGMVLTGAVTEFDFAMDAATFWAGDSTGVAMLAPLLLTLRNPKARLPRFGTQRSNLIFVVSVALLLAAAWIAYRFPYDGRIDYSYLVFPPLILIAVRNGFRRTALAVFLLNTSIIIAVNYRLTDPETVALQLNLMTASYMSLLLAAVFEEYYRSRLRLQHTAYHDVLTGLPNRAQFLERLRELETRSGVTYAVLFLDLNRFKSVNDTYGHTIGDTLLIILAQRLKVCLRPGDTLARLGGDEFAALLPGIGSSHAAEQIARCFSAKVSEFVRVEGYDITTQTSVGMALGIVGETCPTEAMRYADTAMHEAKNTGRIVLFDEGMERRLQERLLLERDLQQALSRGEMSVVYQPIVMLKTHEVVGVEALMRWHHSTLGTVHPERFIPLAEETGHIVELGAWLLDHVLADARHWPGTPCVSINLSVRQLQQRDFAASVQAALERHTFPPKRLILEVTESMIMTDVGSNVAVLGALSQLGVRLAIDDFGTGYASLSYLKRLPVDILKIDQSFLEGVPHDSSNVSLVRAILAMAESLGLEVIAEGVETEAQEAFLWEHHCSQAQGYFYGRPTPLLEQLELS